MYEDAVQTYLRVNSSTNIPIPSLVFAEACLKISRFLTLVFLNNGWSDAVLAKVVYADMTDLKNQRNDRFLTMSELVKCKNSGIARYSIAKYVTKIWLVDIDELSMMDQVNIMTHMTSILSVIGYHRKSAWFMYEMLNRMVPLLIQGRAAAASAVNGNKRHLDKNDDGILEVLKRICEVYGIGGNDMKKKNAGNIELMVGVREQCTRWRCSRNITKQSQRNISKATGNFYKESEHVRLWMACTSNRHTAGMYCDI